MTVWYGLILLFYLFSLSLSLSLFLLVGNFIFFSHNAACLFGKSNLSSACRSCIFLFRLSKSLFFISVAEKKLWGKERMRSFPFGEWISEFSEMSASWWDKINESTQWQDGIFYSLCALYAIVSAVALIQLIRIELRVPEYGWTTQKVFHLMNFIVNGVRAVVFGFHEKVFNLTPKVLILVLLDFPGLLFFSTYTLLVLFWAEIYHQCNKQARGLPADKLKLVYIFINGGIYFLQVSIWIYLWLDDNNVVEFIGRIFIAGVSIVAALGFLVYGGRLFLMLRSFPIESKGRRKKLYQVGFVTAICFICFLVRCFVVFLSAFDSEASLDVLNHPILNFIYYMLVEILPSALVLYILRKLPPKRISAQYHPIR